MKKIIFFTLVLLTFLVFSLFPQESVGDVWVTVDADKTMQGNDFTAEIHANTGTQTFGAFNLDITFDQTVITPSIVQNIITKAVNDTDLGHLQIAGYIAQGIPASTDLVLLTLDCETLGAGVSGIGVVVITLADLDGDPIGTPAGIPASFSIIDRGDVDEDGVLDLGDALRIAQYSIGLTPANFNPDFADANCDGVIDVVDALMIARLYVELIPDIPCEPPIVIITPEDGNAPITYILPESVPATISWDAPDTNGEILGYTLYNRPYGSEDWELYVKTSYTEVEFNPQSVNSGDYEFAVSAIYDTGVDGNIESDLHISTDENAEPTRGWYISIDRE